MNLKEQIEQEIVGRNVINYTPYPGHEQDIPDKAKAILSLINKELEGIENPYWGKVSLTKDEPEVWDEAIQIMKEKLK